MPTIEPGPGAFFADSHGTLTGCMWFVDCEILDGTVFSTLFSKFLRMCRPGLHFLGFVVLEINNVFLMCSEIIYEGWPLPYYAVLYLRM